MTKTLRQITDRAALAMVTAADLEFEAIVNRPAAAYGDTFTVTNRIHNRGKLTFAVRGGATGNGDWVSLLPDSSYEYKLAWSGATIDQYPLTFPGTQPRWLATPRIGDLFGNPTRSMDAIVPGLDAITAVAVASNDSLQAILTMNAPLTYHVADPVRGDMQLPFTIAPGIAINFDRDLVITRAGVGGHRFVNVTLRSAFSVPMNVTVSLKPPHGLAADVDGKTVTVAPNGVRTVTFQLSGALPAGEYDLSATAAIDGKIYSVGYVPIDYDHIPPLRMYRRASVHISSIPVVVPNALTVGYVRGVGDNVPAMLQDLGIPVTTITPGELPSADLSRFSTIVIGTRAYQASQQLIDNNSYLLDYVRRGGTLVSQYGQYEMVQPGVMPYPVTLARPADRVTDEVAEVRVLDAASPLLNSPNKITLADFNGWTQERASYMPTTFDAKYKTVLSMNDPGETPKNSGILVTPFGKGLYVYATLSFFRQLPAGNPGATRLFVNLLSAKPAR